MQISKYTTKNFFDVELVKIKYGTVPFIMVFMFFYVVVDLLVVDIFYEIKNNAIAK